MPATVWKGYLTFGLVSFPIRLYAAARPDPVRFHLLHNKDLSRVKEVMYCAREDKPLDRSEIVKGYEYEKDRYVVIEPEDLEKIAPPTATVMEILQFTRMDEVDPIYLETSYYVAPEESVSRPYTLLFSAMKRHRLRCAGESDHAWPGAHRNSASSGRQHRTPHNVFRGRTAQREAGNGA